MITQNLEVEKEVTFNRKKEKIVTFTGRINITFNTEKPLSVKQREKVKEHINKLN